MITIATKPAKNFKTKESLFVSFPYNLDIIAQIKKLPKRFYVPETKEWEIPAASISDLLSLLPNEKYEIKGKVTTKVKKEIEQMVSFESKVATDFKFKTEPFSHQLEAFEYALGKNKFLLGDEQGLGKTKQSIDIAVSKKGQFKHTLIVCGVNSLKWNWLEEIQIHSNEKGKILGSYYNRKGKLETGSVKDRLDDLNANVEEYFLITNIETLRDKSICERLEHMCKTGIIGMVIVDEIHKAKNPTATQGKAIHCLKSYYKMALTGTPLMNEPIDLYNILKWLDVEKHSFYAFRNRYCEMGGFGGYEITGYKNLKELHELLESVMLRRKKSDVLDLPDKIRTIEYVEMAPKQRVIYKEVLEAVKQNIDTIKLSPNPLAQLIRLRQATGYTGVLSTFIHESAKFDRMEELVEQAVQNGQKCIIFSNWEQMITSAQERLMKYKPLSITGQTRDSDRQEITNKFQTESDNKVILGTIGAMGTGLTLTAATTVIFLDSPWNKATKDQAEDRAHRIGTKSTVNIITLVCKDTIDERIEDIVDLKGDLADMLVDGKKEGFKSEKLVDFLLS